MAINDGEIKRIIKTQETHVFRQRFPKELKAYLYDSYGEDPWPHSFSREDLYSGIEADARAYFMGKLDVTIKPALEKKKAEIQGLRELYSDAMRDIQDLEKYIDELHELLWANGLRGSRMLHSESGKHEGTYAEYNTLHMEEFE